ncbi:hypothetical protein BDY19DRAFT_595102 [Irpex rosettiformis]|uniref:Uncharacterized protein n=1 Tax=Irpex rosettiformis TaxID=378272 RepID=A0ACB8UDA6_9APHY|nr:hypothetical protein BDY19DRAFT_595102 [Irpex rosettiformis]
MCAVPTVCCSFSCTTTIPATTTRPGAITTRMLSVWKTAVAFITMWAVARAQSNTTAVVASFGTDIVLEPPGAWRTTYNEVCLSQDTYTTTVNATAFLTFTGASLILSLSPPLSILFDLTATTGRQPRANIRHAQ